MAKIGNEIIIAALLQHGTIKEAAAAAGTSQRTIYNRLRGDQDFRVDYMEAKAGIVRAASIALNAKLGKAIDTVNEIMLDTEINPAIRLQAAQTIIGNAARFTERLSDEEGKAIEEAEKW